jgi:S-DNA-T family DNA segregation ATPase FtsK/SpoIIIE
MDNRYNILKKAKVKNLEQFRENGSSLPFIFVVVDEYGILAASKQKEQIKNSILELAQKARASGIHLIMTTQRPSTKIISGDIKANFPVRVAFKTATSVDSQVILDQGGAEKLLGKGDMLVLDSSARGLQRLQGYNN